MVEVSERSFEESIECGLLQHGPDACSGDSTAVRETAPTFGDMPPGGYLKRRPEDYDRALCLLPRDAVDFVLATQPKEWQKLAQHHGAAVKEQFLRRLAAEIERRGALEVLRSGIKDSGCKFQLAYFRPASGLNEETRRLHAANLFAAVRQLHYSVKNEKSLDLVLFLNGIPIFSTELKNPLTGQTVEQAIRQYQSDRDPSEPLLGYGRCLAHFAVDPDLVYVTTQLAGPKTRFLPFNQGKFGGAGNPPVPPTRKGYSTTSAGSSPTTCGSTPSSPRCSPSPTPTSRSSTSSRVTCAACCRRIASSCRARCSRTSTWSPTASSRRAAGGSRSSEGAARSTR